MWKSVSENQLEQNKILNLENFDMIFLVSSVFGKPGLLETVSTRKLQFLYDKI